MGSLCKKMLTIVTAWGAVMAFSVGSPAIAEKGHEGSGHEMAKEMHEAVGSHADTVHEGHASHPARAGEEGQMGGEGEIAYWTCAMHPTVRASGPGNCPVCSMELIPVKKGAGLSLTQRQKDLIAVRTHPVGFVELTKEISTVATIEYDERRIAHITTRVGGWIEKLYVDFTGQEVKEGQVLASVYSPELLSAQEEYLAALAAVERMSESGIAEIREVSASAIVASEENLRLSGLTRAQVAHIKSRGSAEPVVDLLAPRSGTVTMLKAKEGGHFMKGAALFEISDLRSLWAFVTVYEYELPWVRQGQKVKITSVSFPGQTFEGTVSFIYPYMDTKTRSVRVRLDVPNEDEALKPGMYVTATIEVTLSDLVGGEGEVTETYYTCPMHRDVMSEGPGKCPKCGMSLIKKERVSGRKAAHVPELIFRYTCLDHPEHAATSPGECPMDGKKLVNVREVLAIPKSSVIDTGVRVLVYVDLGEAGYAPREIKVGPEGWGKIDGRRERLVPVIEGLTLGEVVVTHGNFLIDSQSQISEAAAAAYGGAIGGKEEATPSVHRH